VKFTLEGERGKKAIVYAEVKAQTYDFRYLLVVARDGSRVISIIDHRPPEMSVEDRMSRVTSLLQDAKWTFYADNDLDAREQAKALGDYWLKVRCVRCDEAPQRCDADGVITKPGWKTDAGFVKGVKGLEELEVMVRDVATGKSKSSWWPFG
jgi:hypothetical protein